MLRITAIGAGAVEYLLAGCEAHEHAHELEARADAAELGADRYFAKAMEMGEPQGVWLGKGWEALGLSDIEAGAQAREEQVRAIFGQLRRPDSTERDPTYIGSKPRTYKGYEERLAKLQAAEPDPSPERARAMEREAAAGGTRPVAYYDFTFSPVKSVSVLYAAYLAAGLHGEAEKVRAAHDEAVKIALSYAEQHVAHTRFGRTEHGRVYAEAEGLAVVAFAHHTSRSGDPQLHTHAAVLNRVGTADGRIGALDGKGFRAFKEAIATAYERAVEQEMTDRVGVAFETRPDGKAREVAGVDPALLRNASTRRGQIVERVEAMVERYRDRHGREPGAAARKVMAQEATYDTRAAKTGMAGPAAVAAWADSDLGRRGHLVAAVDEVELAAVAMATAAPALAADPGRVQEAMAAGLADVQAAYSTWMLGNLVDAIDRHLGDAAALGVPAAERPAALEDLARAVIAPGAGFDVVQLTGHEPVEVPAELLRRDGRPVFRPHEERRFATAAHLETEAGVGTYATRTGARVLDRDPVQAACEQAGLSVDQAEAVLGIVTSGRHGDVLIGPAGTGKSRTVGALAHAWSETTGGTVYGVATAQIATANLAGDGLTALNTTRFLGAVTPDPITGQARMPLRPDDLVVVDEASMASTPDLAAISTAAARVGAKVVYVGDPHQLDAVGAGGLFAHLADTLPAGQVHTLDQPHRFQQSWEAEASLQLRDGDPRAVEAYADHGRLVAGTVEEMTAAARRGWLVDRLAGLDAVLVVGTNDLAADMSAELQGELVSLGRVDRTPIAELADDNAAGLGDVIETRRNAWGLRVDPSRDGVAEPVMNRSRYTIVGRGDDGTILGRDRHGAIAHLPADYLAEHAALGYASTVFAAEGITVDASHDVVDRDATREAVYVGASRGRQHNYLYLVTEREPDAHEPQRLAEVAAERLTAVLAREGAQHAAAAVLAGAQLEENSATALLSRLQVAMEHEGHPRHLEHLRERLGDGLAAGIDPADRGTGRLLAALDAAELAGHDPAALLDRAVESRGFDDVDSVPDALRHRIRGLVQAYDPDRAVDSADWTTRVVEREGEPVSEYRRQVAALLSERQRDLGDRVAAEAPAWAVTVGERPDLEADIAEVAAWRDRAGAAALYREHAGIGPDRLSLGAPPSRERPLERALYDAALAATPDRAPESGERDWRAEPDAELYATRERWAREAEQAPTWVADQLADTSRTARQWHEDAVLERARLEQLAPDARRRDELERDAARHERMAADDEAHAATLRVAHERRGAWWERTTGEREADKAAADELDRRGLPETRATVERPDPEPVRLVPEETQAERDAERVASEQARERLRAAVELSEQRREARAQELARVQEQARLAAVEAQAKQRERSRAAYAEIETDLELQRAQQQLREMNPAHQLQLQRERDIDAGLEME
ncbi:MobF family relaxase [Actinomycetospora soli]|uniref:MobF family relaxase n=1 Tax=Actinomycetospora soli TaxID=2893887 RepID=UPI001E5D5C7B|nr:MobF family relaxase [Actinomycetospora soli]MCD2191012.1 relaxase domain-containing protein [Actinomycetospora soli]